MKQTVRGNYNYPIVRYNNTTEQYRIELYIIINLKISAINQIIRSAYQSNYSFRLSIKSFVPLIYQVIHSAYLSISIK